MTESALLNLVDVSRRFGGIEALKDINLEIARSELVGLIGPNGSDTPQFVAQDVAVIEAYLGPSAMDLIA